MCRWLYASATVARPPVGDGGNFAEAVVVVGKLVTASRAVLSRAPPFVSLVPRGGSSRQHV